MNNFNISTDIIVVVFCIWNVTVKVHNEKCGHLAKFGQTIAELTELLLSKISDWLVDTKFAL